MLSAPLNRLLIQPTASCHTVSIQQQSLDVARHNAVKVSRLGAAAQIASVQDFHPDISEAAAGQALDHQECAGSDEKAIEVCICLTHASCSDFRQR